MRVNSKEIYSNKELLNVLEEGKEKGYRIEKISCGKGNVYAISENEENHILIIPSKIEKIEESVNSYLQDLKGNIRVIGGSGLKDTSDMFYNCEIDTLDLRNFDTSKVINMSYMFFDCKADSLDLSSFDTSNVRNMSCMFSGCKADSLDLSSFNTSNVTDMSYMFYICKVNSLNLSSFDTSKVTDMSYMFSNCRAKELDLSSFDTSNVKDMSAMFFNSEVEEIKLSENKRNFEIDETDFEEDFELE